jgi:hypothetical protein
MSKQRTRPPLPLLLGFAAFLAVIGYLIAASMVKPRVAEFSPTLPGVVPAGGPGPDTVTIDATDEARWRFYSFTRGVLDPPDTAAWDLGFRRYHVIAWGTVSPSLAHWYKYGFVTHLLTPDGRVFMVETRGGTRARMEFLSYYCPGSQPGCLTFRWAWMNAPGKPRQPFR